MKALWGDEHGITWANADAETREQFALVRMFWFFRMKACGGPDGSALDAQVMREAQEASDWFEPILAARAGIAITPTNTKAGV